MIAVLSLATAMTEQFLGWSVLCAIAIYLFVRWFRQGTPKPDPWELEPAQAAPGESGVSEVPLCVRCLTPHVDTAYFCPHCGHAVGPYNNYMPFIQIFSEGEVFRAGTDGTARRTPFIVIGYVLLSLAALPAFVLLAPLYWIALWRSNYRSPVQTPQPPPASPTA